MGKEVYIGIDPGLSGAIAAVDGRGMVLLVDDLPTITSSGKKKEIHLPEAAKMVIGLMEGASQVFGAVEKVGARPGQGVVSMFRFGVAAGQMHGILTGLKIPIILVRPQIWQKEFLRFTDGPDNKAKSVLAASYRWPDVDLPRKKDHGKAEALLIAEFCRKYHQGKLEI